ncbi:MAG: hypothetical protein VYC90_05380, partial [Pseudomonadota bacterium]|nr:hypothetical protein [Pseudomonadota bacterium]
MTPATHHILGQERPRVWSCIVTIFCDLARADSPYISYRTLNRLTAQIGVKPEATRVALHRLRKEDWLESAKFGRESHYRLTDNGRALSREAAPRIYGAASDEAWMLAIYDPNKIAPEGLRISSGMILVTSECAGAMNLAVTDPLPLWMVDRLVQADVQSAIHNLHARLAGFSAEPDAAELDRAVLRLSLVHEWRRIILRVPDVPDLLFENAFSLGELRGNVQRLLSALSDVSLEQIIDS